MQATSNWFEVQPTYYWLYVRARRRQHVTDDPRPPRDYSWAPFAPGHEVTLQHGAYSERKLAPLAAEIEQRWRRESTWPTYLADPMYDDAVTTAARAQATYELLFAFVAGRDIGEAMTEQLHEEVQETAGRGQPRRRVTSARRTSNALQLLFKAEAAAARARAEIGFSPVSRAKLSRDMTATAVQANLATLQSAGAELVRKARDRGLLADTSSTSPAAVDGQLGDEEGTE